MTLADVLNSETEKEFEGVKYKLRQMTVDEEGAFQRWMEELAFNAIERQTYANPDHKDRAHAAHIRDCAAGIYEWGQEASIRRFQTIPGIAKILYLVCREQGLTEEKALVWAKKQMAEIAATLIQKTHGANDPKALEAVCLSLGLPPDFLSSWSVRHSTGQSPNSGGAAGPSSTQSGAKSTGVRKGSSSSRTKPARA